jgi:hypothetical protein
MFGDKILADARERQRAGLKKGTEIPVTLKSAPRGQQGETAAKIAKFAKVGRDVAREALRVHRDDGAARKSQPKSKPAKPKPPVNKTAKEYIVKKFQRFLDAWPVTQQRIVKTILCEYMSNQTSN